MRENLTVIFPRRRAAELVRESWEVSPGANEILGRTLYSVVSSGSECGGYMDFYGGEVYPKMTGYAGVMEVEEISPDVTGVRPGDRVFAQTPHRLYNLVREDEIVVVPPDMPAELAVLCRFPAVSMTAMVQTAVRPTEPILVAGLGIVGLSCAQMMRKCGYDVFAVDPVQSRRDTASRCGIERTYPDFNALPEVRFGLAIDCTGSDAAVLNQARRLRKGGELFLVGVPWRRTSEATMHDFMNAIFNGFLTVRSGWEWSLPLRSSDFLPNSNFHSFKKAMQWIQEGALRYDGVYHLYNPANCAEVYEAIACGTLPCTCAIYDWHGIH